MPMAMHHLPSFSVVIPIYNRVDRIRATINSVLSQTYQDFEIIAIDDGSKDDCETVIRNIDDPRIRFFRQENAGANVARNRGIEESRGRYIAFLDSDDCFLPHHLESAVAALSDKPAIYFAQVIADRGCGNTFIKPPRAPKVGEAMSEYLCCDMGFVQTSTLVVPAWIAKEIRYLDWLPYGQDVDYALRLAHAGHPFLFSAKADAVWDDVQTGKRISSGSRGEVRERWARENRHLLTDRAYRGFMGWRSAKAYAEGGKLAKGVSLFARSAAAGAYAPKHAARVFLQVALAGGIYQKLVSTVLNRKKKHK